MKKVFLGGTCNNSEWRYVLIPALIIDYFNPVVDDWTEECYQEELKQREICDYCLYVITPNMTGVYSIAEVVDDSNKRPDKTILCVLEKDTNWEWIHAIKNNFPKNLLENTPKYVYFDIGQLKSLDRTGRMVKNNGGQYFKSLREVADYLNK